MNDPLYKRSLLRLAADAHGAGSLPGAPLHGQAHNPACGDRVAFDVTLSGVQIAALAQRTQACVLTQASASILGREATGETVESIAALRTQVAAMLRGDALPPEAPFAAFAEFAGAAEMPGRHVCVLLPIDALLDALLTKC